MIIPEYKRNLNHSFLILPGEKMEDVIDYQWEMVCANKFYELLSSNRQIRNGAMIYSYEISSKQNIKRIFESKELVYEDIKNILITIHNLLTKMREHLLDENCLILYPEYIYFDMEIREVQLIFYPESSQKIQNGLKELTEFFLSRTNHKDEKAVEVVYLMFKEINDENFTLSGIINLFEKLECKADDFAFVRNENVYEIEKELDYPDEEKKQKKNHIFILYIIIGISISIFMGRSMKGDNFLVLCYGAIIVLLTSIILFFLNRKETVKYEKQVTEYEEVEDFKSEIVGAPEEDMFACFSEVEEKIKKYGCTGKMDFYKEENNCVVVKEISCLEGEIHGISICIPVKDKAIIIGRLPEMVDVVLDYPNISRLHAKIERNEESRLILTDLNASNGTYVNDVLLDPNQSMFIKVEDRIRLAEITLVCKA